MQKPQRAVRSRRASLWWRTVYSKEPSTHSNHRLRTKKREEKKQAVSSYHPLLPSPSLWECLFFFPSFWKCFEPLEFYRRVKACELPKAPKLTFDTVLYTFTNKPNRCYWSSRSSSETKIIALSQPQDNPNPLTILPVSQLHWCPPQPSLGRFDYGGGCQGWGGPYLWMEILPQSPLSQLCPHSPCRPVRSCRMWRRHQQCSTYNLYRYDQPVVFPPSRNTDSYISVENHSI